MKDIKLLGIDLAKNIFQLHGSTKQGKCILRKRLSRDKLMEFIVTLAPCTIGIEACTGAHEWARKFQALGHDVKMISPQFVKPFVKSNKNDKNDAEAIVEAMSRPGMRFVPIKTLGQQDMLLIHRARELAVKQRSMQANQIRGLLAEYGFILPKGIGHIRKKLTERLDEAQKILNPLAYELFLTLQQQFKALDEQLKRYDAQLERLAKTNPSCQRLLEVDGVGPIIATAAVATIGDVSVFKNGRDVAAWLGLVPKQHSSGNKVRLGGISKRGDRYLRSLLIHGGRSVVYASRRREDARSRWVSDKENRCGTNKASVAVANKNARVIWVLLARDEVYDRNKAGMRKACLNQGGVVVKRTIKGADALTA